MRNAYGFCWNERGEMFATENGPDADAPEELNQIEQGRHYGFPYTFANILIENIVGRPFRRLGYKKKTGKTVGRNTAIWELKTLAMILGCAKKNCRSEGCAELGLWLRCSSPTTGTRSPQAKLGATNVTGFMFMATKACDPS